MQKRQKNSAAYFKWDTCKNAEALIRTLTFAQKLWERGITGIEQMNGDM